MYGVRACAGAKKRNGGPRDICFSHQGHHLLGHALGELRVLQRNQLLRIEGAQVEAEVPEP